MLCFFSCCLLAAVSYHAKISMLKRCALICSSKPIWCTCGRTRRIHNMTIPLWYFDICFVSRNFEIVLSCFLMLEKKQINKIITFFNGRKDRDLRGMQCTNSKKSQLWLLLLLFCFLSLLLSRNISLVVDLFQKISFKQIWEKIDLQQPSYKYYIKYILYK